MAEILPTDSNGAPSILKKSIPKTLQVRFITKQQDFAIPDVPYELSSGVGPEALNNLVNQVLQDDGVLEKPKTFDFLVGGEFLRGSLEELVLRHELLKQAQADLGEDQNELKVGTEELFEVEYVEKWPTPEPKDCLLHDDWVSSIDATSDWILSGCYDATVHLWTTTGKHKETVLGHDGPVKKVRWVQSTEDKCVFVSGSQDQTLMLWEWDQTENDISCRAIFKGHERSIESLAISDDKRSLSSGSWDGMLKLWSASVLEAPEDSKAEDKYKPRTRTPIMTLAGHKESVSALAWSGSSELISASWDHTLKVWDIEGGHIKFDVAGNKAFFDMSWSPLNNTAITSSADRHLRLYDPRSNEGSIVKAMFTSHSAWVSSVNWSMTNENLFISGSHDLLTKVWDRRSPRAPLYNLTGHSEKILSTNWSNPKLILSGGSDNTLRIFAAKDEI